MVAKILTYYCLKHITKKIYLDYFLGILANYLLLNN